MRIRLRNSKLSPDVYAAVMATGILSIAARNHHYERVSAALLAVAVVGLLSITALVVVVSILTRRFSAWKISDPQVTLPLFTFVAGCAVVANRLSSHRLILSILGAIAGAAWLGLGTRAIRNVWGQRLSALRNEMRGVWLLASVATSGLAIVTAKLAISTGHRQWLFAAAPLWFLALTTYIAITFLMLWRVVDERLDRNGFEPDTWILMGSMAIAVVAGHTIHQQTRHGPATVVHVVTVIAWVVATLWIPPLIYFGLHHVEERPKVLKFTGAWWTLVFPLGMYSAATHLMASEIQQRSLETVSLVFFWVALTVCLIVAFAGMFRIPRALAAIDASR